MRKCLFALTSFLPAAALAATIWTWVDERGQRHYSDREVPGATALEVSGAQSFSGAVLRSAQPPAATGAEESAEAVSYSVLEVLSPEPEETLRNIEGTLAVEVATVPALAAGHRIDVLLDGERQSIDGRSLQFTVPEVWRGTHTLTALIVNAEDEVLIRSRPVTFYVHQTSIAN